MNKTLLNNKYDIEELKTDKKINAEYWDEIDNISEHYVEQLIKLSAKGVLIPDFMSQSDVIAEVGKIVAENTINVLEKHFGAEFPYVEGCL